jgi:hypothetical protein
MILKVGAVISNKRGLWVITQIANGTIVDTEPLESFISNNVVLEFDGERRTISEIIQIHCGEYLSKNEVIKE